jgi:RNA polymerase sigma-70 factor (ECF subfamily)
MEPQRLSETIAAAKQGRHDAFEALLEAYGQRLYGYFYRATANPHDAEDLLSEISLRLVRTLRNYDERGRFEPWLFRIAANMIRDRIRRLRTAATPVSLATETETGDSLADQVADEDVSPADAAMMAAEASAELKEALARLDATTRDMILLRHFGQMSFREIAEVYKCPLGTVLARVHRGLKTLRRLMGAEDAGE